MRDQKANSPAKFNIPESESVSTIFQSEFHYFVVRPDCMTVVNLISEKLIDHIKVNQLLLVSKGLRNHYFQLLKRWKSLYKSAQRKALLQVRLPSRRKRLLEPRTREEELQESLRTEPQIPARAEQPNRFCTRLPDVRSRKIHRCSGTLLQNSNAFRKNRTTLP